MTDTILKWPPKGWLATKLRREPKERTDLVRFADTQDRDLLSSREVSVYHKDGSLRIRLMLTGFENVRGETLPGCKISMFTTVPKPTGFGALPFYPLNPSGIEVERSLKGVPSVEIIKVLAEKLLNERVGNIEKDQQRQVIVGLFLPDGDFYLASEPPIPANHAPNPIGQKRASAFMMGPFYLKAESKGKVQDTSSRGFVLYGSTWQEAQIGLIGPSTKVGQQYATQVVVPVTRSREERFDRSKLAEIKDRVPLTSLILSKEKLVSKRVKRVIGGFVAWTNEYPGLNLMFISVRVPMMMYARPNRLQQLLLSRKKESNPVWGVTGIGVHIEVPEDKPSIICGSLSNLSECVESLKMSSTEDDYSRLSKQYRFPVDFLKRSYELSRDYEREEGRRNLVENWKDEAIAMMRDDGYHVDEDLVEVDFSALFFALWQMYGEEKWLPIFRNWHESSERGFEQGVRRVERSIIVLYAIYGISGIAIGIAGWGFRAGILTAGNLLSLVLAGVFVPLISYLASLLFRRPEITKPEAVEESQ